MNMRLKLCLGAFLGFVAGGVLPALAETAFNFQNVFVDGYYLTDRSGVVGSLQSFTGSARFSVEPMQGGVYVDEMNWEGNVGRFTAAVPFGYRVDHWVYTAKYFTSHAAATVLPDSQGAATVTWKLDLSLGSTVVLAPVYAFDDSRSFTLKKSPFGEGSVGTNFATYACQRGDVFRLAAVPAHDDATGFGRSTFRRWSDGVTESRRDVVIETNVVLTAEFVPSSWQVSFNANGGTVHPASKRVTCDATYGWLPDPVRAGHHFSGWYDDSLNGSKIGFDTRVGAVGDHTLYARWTADLYEIGYALGGEGSGTVEGAGRYAYGSAATLTAKPLEGSVFAGWADGETRNQRRDVVTSNAVYVANFAIATYEIAFAYRNARGDEVLTTNQVVRHGEAAVPPDEATVNAWPGHDFKVWSSEEYRRVTRDRTGVNAIQAVYDDVTHVVTFVYRGSDGSMVTGMPVHVVEGQSATPPDAFANRWAGHKLTGWLPDCSAVKEDLTVEAQYELSTYTVEFDYFDKGGKSAVHSETVAFEEKVPFGADSVTSLTNQWTGHTFKYWSLNGKEIVGDVVVSNDLKIVGVYDGYARVSYDPNGGDGGEMTNEVYAIASGESLDVSLASNVFTKTGYTFTNWLWLLNAGTKVYFEDGASVTLQDGTACNLDAQWKPITYTLELDWNGGKSLSSEFLTTRMLTYDKEEVIKYANDLVEKEDYDLLGWDENGAATTPAYPWNSGNRNLTVSNLTTVAGATVTFYAIWEKKESPPDEPPGGGEDDPQQPETTDLSEALFTTNALKLKVVSNPTNAWVVGSDSNSVERTAGNVDGSLEVTIPCPGTLTFTFDNESSLGGNLKVKIGTTENEIKSKGLNDVTIDGEGVLTFSGTPKLNKTWTLKDFKWTPKAQ